MHVPNNPMIYSESSKYAWKDIVYLPPFRNISTALTTKFKDLCPTFKKIVITVIE